MPLRHVAFDLDGTLVDSAADIAASVGHALRRHGLPPVAFPVVRAAIGDGVRTLVERMLGPTEREAHPEVLQTFLAHYADHAVDQTRLFPGVRDVLEELQRGGRVLSVVTNKVERLAVHILDRLGVGGFFAAVIGGDTLPTRKPDPAGLLLAIGRTGCRPAEAVLVGDSPIDLETAEAAQVGFWGAGWGFDAERLRTRAPDRTLDRVDDLLRVTSDDRRRLDSARGSG